MKILKTALAAISAGLALYSIYGAIAEVTGNGGVLPMLRFEAFMDHPTPRTLLDHAVCAALFSIYPIWFAVRRNRKI